MSKYSALIKRASNATAALALTLASLTPAVMLGGNVKAGQMTRRQITMSDSEKTVDNTTYTVSFENATAATIKGIVVEFCSNNPIIGASCTAPTGLDVAGTADNQAIGSGSTTFDADDDGTNLVIMTDATGEAATVGEVFTFTINVDNPNDLGTFYARVLTFTDDTVAGSYDDTTPGAYTDAGGIALSTTDDLTINARVQETLTFCAGADADASATTTCGALDGQIVDLGVLSTAVLTNTPTDNTAAVDGNAKEGKILVATNAFYGVKIYYLSDTSLRVGSTACEDDDSSFVNQCFNSSSTGAGLLSAGTEGFGMIVTEPTSHETVAGESTLTAQGAYAGANHAWVTDAATEIARTTSVVAMDGATLEFAATPSATTPSGYYTTSANFIAVASF